jgi:spore coat-associated protein N
VSDRKSRRETAYAARSVTQGRKAKQVLVALLLLAVGSATAVVGTSSTFTDTDTRTQNSASGTFNIDLSDPLATSQFSAAVSGMAPGDFADRLVDLTNTGSINLASVAVAVTTPTSSLLDTDATNGLQLEIDKCSVAWTQASSGVVAACGGVGGATTLTAMAAISSLKATGPSYTASLTSLTGGGAVDRLRFHYSLPTASTGTAGLSSVIVYTVTATQAAGGAYH